MKRSIKTIMAIVAASAAVAASASAGTLRESLVDDRSVELVYAIDDFNTFVVGESALLGEKSAEFTVIESDRADGTYVVRHSSAQPFVYKSPVLPSYAEIELPEAGEIRFNSGNSGGRFMEYTGLDLYEHMYAVCRKSGGEPGFLIPTRSASFKRLAEATPFEAFGYIVSGDSQGGAWEFACNGEKRFLLSKDYRFSPSAAETASLFTNRGFEGTSYIKASEVAPVKTVSLSESERARLIEETALEAANLRTSFVRGALGSRYEGLYTQASRGCALVSVKHSTVEDSGIRVYDYRVCGRGKATLVAERVEEVKTAKAVRIHHGLSVLAKAE